jgi:hypothetical protein
MKTVLSVGSSNNFKFIGSSGIQFIGHPDNHYLIATFIGF